MTSRLTKEEWNNLQPGDMVLWEDYAVLLLLVLEREEYGELFCWCVAATESYFLDSRSLWSYDRHFKKVSS